MIISIKVRNFYSLRDDAALDFTAAINARNPGDSLAENLLEFKGDRFLNIIGLFGGNAAGKSNVIKAIDFCLSLVKTSHISNSPEGFDFEPFKFQSEDSSDFYIDFVIDDVEYEYSFELKDGKIISESLYYYPKKRKAKIFSREKTNLYSYGKGVISRPTEIEANTGPQTLFLSRASSMNRLIIQNVYRYLTERIKVGVGGFDMGCLSRQGFESGRELLLKAFEVADSDIIDIQWDESIPGQPRLKSYHKENPAVAFDFEREESEGTKRLLYILLALLNINGRKCTILLDEFDLKLHIHLAQFLLDVIRASRGMQLVFTSHNPILIDTSKLRPEQIVLVDKLQDGSSELVPLSDFEGLERIPDIRKAYLQGRFDGIPYIGNIYPLISNTDQ